MPRLMMWLNYRRNSVDQETLAVPSPFDGDPSVAWWYDAISHLAPELAHMGFTDVLFPNPVMGQSGAYPTGDGYNPTDDYDLGSKGSPTRFGTVEQLRRAVAVCHANGLNVLMDVVMHQRMGGRGGVYAYRGSDRKTFNGRFPKHPSCFRGPPPGVPEDPVPSPADDFAFGDELCPINATPAGYVSDGLIAANQWMFATTGSDGARLDDMKGLNAGFVTRWIRAMGPGKWFFGEYASGNRDDTDWWVGQVDGLASATDFDFHYNMAQPMCMDAGAGNFDMRSMAGRGMIGSNPIRAVPFVESMDSDTNGFATIVNNKLLAYALLLTGEGLPIVYVKDYLAKPAGYGLAPGIANLAWIHATLAGGRTVPRWQPDRRVHVFERDGDPRILVALSNDVWNPEWKFAFVQTGFRPNHEIKDYSGQAQNTIWTDYQGRATVPIPPAANGRGYSIWAEVGHEGRAVPITPRTTTQTFFGAADLDITPLPADGTLAIGRVWAAAGTALVAALTPDEGAWGNSVSIILSVLDPSGAVLTAGSYDDQGDATQDVRVSDVVDTGWHTLRAVSTGLPAAGSAFALRVTYTGGAF